MIYGYYQIYNRGVLPTPPTLKYEASEDKKFLRERERERGPRALWIGEPPEEQRQQSLIEPSQRSIYPCKVIHTLFRYYHTIFRCSPNIRCFAHHSTRVFTSCLLTQLPLTHSIQHTTCLFFFNKKKYSLFSNTRRRLCLSVPLLSVSTTPGITAHYNIVQLPYPYSGRPPPPLLVS